MTSASALLHGIEAGSLQFKDVIAHIDAHYDYHPISFHNGEIFNETGTNVGSAKVFSFAKLNGLNQLDTLKLFCEHYQAVLDAPNGTDHPNIRQFLHHGWQGVGLNDNALNPR